MRNDEIKDETRKWENKIKQNDLEYGTNRYIIYIYIYIYDFQNFETIRSFGDSIYAGKVNLDEEEIDQTNLF